MGPGEPCPEIVIRPSSDADVAAMIAIYEHHIAKGSGMRATSRRSACCRTT